MLNRVILMGRLVADPELKTTATGLSVTSFRIAVERSYVKAGEERKADFFDIVCWRNSAEFVCHYFHKGSMIAIDGQLQSRTYQAKDGTNRYVTEVVANSVSFTGEKQNQNNSTYQQPPVQTPQQQSQGSAKTQSAQDSYAFVDDTQPAQQMPMSSYTNFEDMPIDDDLPF